MSIVGGVVRSVSKEKQRRVFGMKNLFVSIVITLRRGCFVIVTRKAFWSLASVACMMLVMIGQSAVQAQVARSDFYPITTMTLSDTELLNGSQTGKPTTIAGVLNVPKPGNDKLPAVIILHGSSGPGGMPGPVADWSRQFNALGIAAFALDCFAGRGIISTSAEQGSFGRLNMIVDAYRALDILVHHPRIDSKRIALVGISRGGQGALYAAMKRMRTAYGPVDSEFAAFIALYPNCITAYRDDGMTMGKPIRIFHGTADDYNPIAPCRSYVERAAKTGADISLLEYEGGQHGFDGEGLRSLVQCKTCQTDRHCKLAEKEGGIIYNLETGKPFSYSDACVEKGTTMGFSATQGPRAQADVLEFVKTLFGFK